MAIDKPAFDTSNNSSFSTKLPGLQWAVDSTSLGEFKTCPRKYYYSIICGYQPRSESVDLVFGILLHGGRERYDHGRAKGMTHEECLHLALRWALAETWDKELGRPKFPESNGPKNRLTLVQTLVWYLDEFGTNDSLETVTLANGKPAVELSFSFDSGLKYRTTGEAIILCGHLDRIATLNDVPYIADLKTTKNTLSPSFFDQFSPNNQFSLYALAGRVAFGQPIKALIVDACQIGVTFSRFQRQVVQRDEAQVTEWLGGLGFWLQQMEVAAVSGHWPQNDKACQMYGGCQYRSICGKSPVARDKWLESDFKKRTWDPLLRRGDI